MLLLMCVHSPISSVYCCPINNVNKTDKHDDNRNNKNYQIKKKKK